MLVFRIPNHGLDTWFEREQGQKEGEIVGNKNKFIRVQGFRVMLGFWIKPCMSLDAWFGSVENHEKGEIVGNKISFLKFRVLG
jgi:hypothetical protein